MAAAQANELQQLPTIAIVCTASLWCFVAYTPATGPDQRGKLVQSSPFLLPLVPRTSIKQIKDSLADLVPQFTGLIVDMMHVVDTAKLQRSDIQLLPAAGGGQWFVPVSATRCCAFRACCLQRGHVFTLRVTIQHIVLCLT